MSKHYRIASLLLGLLLVVGCTTPTPPTSAVQSPSSTTTPVAAQLAPQVKLEHQQHLDMLLGSGVLAQSWASVAELDPDIIVAYYTSLVQADAQLPQHGSGLIPAETVEQMASIYFDATPEQLRQSTRYSPDKDCYELVGLGSVAFCAIRKVLDDESKTVILFDIFWDGVPYADGELTIAKRTDGSWYYSSFELTQPNVTAEQQEQWNPVLSLLGNSGFLSSSWESGSEVPPHCYITLYIFTRLREPGFSLTDADILALPAEEFEALMQQQFDVSTEHLRTVSEYDKATHTYQIQGGVGSGPSIRLESVTEQDGKVILTYLVYARNDEREWEGTLTVKQEGDTLRYLGNERRSLTQQVWEGDNPTPNQLELFSHLTTEQKALYQKGMKYLGRFKLDTSWFEGDEYEDTNGVEDRTWVDPVSGLIYDRYDGTMYKGWDDFYNDCLTVFTQEFFDELNNVPYMDNNNPVPLYISREGKLYHRPHDRGGDHTYMPDLNQYSLNLATKDYISVNITYYYQEGSLELDGPPVSCRTREFILRRTADGWRIAHLELPY